MSIRMLVVLMFVLVTALPVAGQAQTKQPAGMELLQILTKDRKLAIYNAPVDEVFIAAVKVAASQGTVLFVHEKSGTLSFQSVSHSVTNSWGNRRLMTLSVSVAVTGLPDGTTEIQLTTQTVGAIPWGAVGRDFHWAADQRVVKAFFAALRLALK